MDLQRLKLLIKQKEGIKLDFKEILNLDTESEKKELAKDIIAIANSIGGRGYLIIGVKDKVKDIIGVNIEQFSEERIQQIISYRCDPPINVRVESVNYEDKYIGVITIFKSNQRPHQMRQTGAFYIRRGSTTDFARRDEIASMLQEVGVISNEQIPIYSLDIDVLNRDNISNYLSKIGMVSSEESELEIWRSLGFIHLDNETGKYHPTVGGVLLFSEFPQKYLPHCSIRFLLLNNKVREKTHIVEGNLIDMLTKSINLLKEILGDSNEVIDAISTCIANAVLHRDYFDISREIVVAIGSSKIEISNPGALPKGNNVYDIMKEKNPSRRNSWLYHRLMVLDDEKRFMNTGVGLKQVKKAFEGFGKVKYLNIYKRNMFKAILPGLDIIKENVEMKKVDY